jgi:hypothetical protein
VHSFVRAVNTATVRRWLRIRNRVPARTSSSLLTLLHVSRDSSPRAPSVFADATRSHIAPDTFFGGNLRFNDTNRHACFTLNGGSGTTPLFAPAPGYSPCQWIRFCLSASPTRFLSDACLVAARVPTDTTSLPAVVMYHGRGLRLPFHSRQPGASTSSPRDSLGRTDTFPRSIFASELHGASLRVLVSGQANFVLHLTKPRCARLCR